MHEWVVKSSFVHTKTKVNPIATNFQHLPTFAQYLLTHKLENYTKTQTEIAFTLDIPLMAAFQDMNEVELHTITLKFCTEFLTHLANNDAEKQIQISIERWLSNSLPNVNKHDVVAKDIHLISLLRKKTLMHFLPEYCRDMEQIIRIIEEIDIFMARYEMAGMEAYLKLMQEKIDEHSNFINKINNTLPGAIYIFDLDKYQNVYSNKKIKDVLGYSQEELNALGTNAMAELIHPEDSNELIQHLEKIKHLQDGEISSYKYRIKKPNGSYEWIRNYASVFKRKADGTAEQTISISLDIHKEKIIAEELKAREQELLEAQVIAQLGSFVWNFNNEGSTLSPQLEQILEIEPDDFTGFMDKVVENDKKKVEEAIQEAIKTGLFNCEYGYKGKDKEKRIWTRGKVTYKEGKPALLKGTVVDITEQHTLLQQLRTSEEVYKLAEELANIGNWSWDLKTNSITWTDQLYKIYGLEPQSQEITIDAFLSFVHPEDKIVIENDLINNAASEFIDRTFRIITRSGEIKSLRSIARLQKDASGNPVFMIGTEQDITEREMLFHNLNHSQSLYKQAEALAHIGSWSWDIEKDQVKWTDELYRIYGLEPQSIDINFEIYQGLIHPDDKEMVLQTIQQSLRSHKPYEFIHRIRSKNGDTRYIQSHGEIFTDKNEQPYKLIGTAQDITERQNLIERLQESEKLYKQAQSLANLGNWTIDLKTQKFIWSDEMFVIYEMERGEPFNIDEWFKLIHPEDREMVKDYWANCLQKKQPYDLIHRILLQNGKVKTLHRKGELLLDQNGEPIKAFGTTQDITEQYRIRKELEENQNFIRKITDATPSIITSYNVHTGKYVFVSEGLKKLLGFSVQDALEQGVEFFVKLVHPDDLPRIISENANKLEAANTNIHINPDVAEFTYRVLDSEGKYRWVTTYGTIFDRNASGQVEHVLNITLDVTDHIQATEKIQEQELFIKQVADASPTILYLFDCNKNAFTYINHEVYYVLGYSPEEIMEMENTSTSLLYHPDDLHLLPERKETGKKFQHSNSMIQYECRMKNKQDDWCWVVVREVVFKRDESGTPTQILGAALDITKRKEMERSLLQNAYQLEQSNASLEEFAYVASHDLKEPLRKISTFGDRIMQTQQERLGDDGKLYLRKIVDASQRMQIMINDLLSISMISGDRSFQPYSLQSILEDVKQTLEFKIEQKNAVITAQELPEANLVPSQFRQLFQNLLSNSLKFTKEDQQPVINIECAWLEPAQVTGQVNKASKYLKLDFIDNGIGFEEEYNGKIFQIFQRLHGRSEYEGTGIGLAICKKIVEHHGGVIYANSQPGNGATFTIILPA